MRLGLSHRKRCHSSDESYDDMALTNRIRTTQAHHITVQKRARANTTTAERMSDEEETDDDDTAAQDEDETLYRNITTMECMKDAKLKTALAAIESFLNGETSQEAISKAKVALLSFERINSTAYQYVCSNFLSSLDVDTCLRITSEAHALVATARDGDDEGPGNGEEGNDGENNDSQRGKSSSAGGGRKKKRPGGTKKSTRKSHDSDADGDAGSDGEKSIDDDEGRVNNSEEEGEELVPPKVCVVVVPFSAASCKPYQYFSQYLHIYLLISIIFIPYRTCLNHYVIPIQMFKLRNGLNMPWRRRSGLMENEMDLVYSPEDTPRTF